MDLYQTSRAVRAAGVFAAAIGISLSNAAAQEPGRTITIVVPYTAGSAPDILARTVGEGLQQRWSQPVVIENKPGATGNIGTQAVARAAPDGNTLLVVANGFTANVSLLKSVPYDPVKSFAPIVMVATGSLALVVHPSVPASSTKQFIEYVRARPGQLNYSSPGVGGPHHLAMELLKLAAKIDIKHVPYKGGAGALQDLVGGHVSAGFQSVQVALPLVQSNQLRMLAVASKARARLVPHVPTLLEEGLPVEVELWFGILAPAGTPPAIVDRYNKEINELIRVAQVGEKLTKQGLTMIGGTPERFAEFIVKDVAKWRNVVKETGIAAE